MPTIPYLYNSKSSALAGSNKYSAVIDNYNKAIELDLKYFEPHKNKFCSLYNLRHYEEAVETCNTAIKLEPNRPDIHEVYRNRALALNQLKGYDEALESAKKVTNLNPNYEEGYIAKVYPLLQLNRKEETIVVLEEIIKLHLYSLLSNYLSCLKAGQDKCS